MASVNAFKGLRLNGCEQDATDMRNLVAIKQGFPPEDAKLLLGSEATFANVVVEVRRAAAILQPGDIFFFTFAGHGSVRTDIDEGVSPLGEPSGNDQAIVLFDRLMFDDYVSRVLWPEFRPGVRIFGIADSCHSGSALFAISEVTLEFAEHLAMITSGGPGIAIGDFSARIAKRVLRADALRRSESPAAEGPSPIVPDLAPAVDDEVVKVGFRDRGLTDEVRLVHSEEYRPIYEEKVIPSLAAAPPVQADLLLLAACEDTKKTKDGVPNGAFTKALLEVWNNGQFSGNYITFKEEITKLIQVGNPDQNPIFKPNALPDFSLQKPFTI